MLPEIQVEGAEQIYFGPKALAKIERMDVGKQQMLSSGLQIAYSRVLGFLLRCSAQSYVHINDVKSLNLLTKDVTLFVVAGMTCHVRIDPSSFVWRVVDVDERNPGTWCVIHEF
jgi:hypothetical protein